LKIVDANVRVVLPDRRECPRPPWPRPQSTYDQLELGRAEAQSNTPIFGVPK